MKPHIGSFVSSGDHTLHLGCGNSALTESMWADGFLDQVNIDYSETVIRQMQERSQHLPDTIQCVFLTRRCHRNTYRVRRDHNGCNEDDF